MKNRKIELFSETALTILVSVVTLLLQIISFATTWSGSEIYLEGVFSCASLLFAIAIQATAYFFSNSLRNKVSALKVLAMLVAMCCSTYYSYIGIYNSVNSPVRFLQERYVQIEEELAAVYDKSLEKNVGIVRQAVNDAASRVTEKYMVLSAEKENMEACRTALAEKKESYAADMRAPRQSDYEEYEDYVADYNAYVAAVSGGSNVEEEAARKGVLASYGFASMEDLQKAEAENASALAALGAALGVAEGQGYDKILVEASGISVKLAAAVDNGLLGQELNSTDSVGLNRLFQAASLCGYRGESASELTHILKSVSETTKEPIMADYAGLVASLEGGRVTSANAMELKGLMDSEILTATLKMNTLLPAEEQISYSDERYMITDLYLIPIRALQDETTRMTAAFCLGMAALVDMLSVLFAISLRKRKPLWKRRLLLLGHQEDYLPQIYASLPAKATAMEALAEFLEHFVPSPETEGDGYMLRGDMRNLKGYETLAALLCQMNLAKLVPAEFLEQDSEVLLLKARFVFWVNDLIYDEKNVETV